MLELVNIQARSLELSRLFLTWETEGSADPQDYDIYVERAGAPSGPWHTLTPQPLVDRYMFVDVQQGLMSRWERLHYRLRVVRRAGGDTAYFPRQRTTTLVARPTLDALEMARQEMILLREFTGRECWLFKKRTFGPRCPECWDVYSQQVTKSGCLTCYGTGYAGGYHRPMKFWIQIDPAADNPQLAAPVGELRPVTTTARTIFFPPVDPRDVIVEPENVRWRVGPRTNTERVRHPVKQEMQLVRIIEGDVEFNLPISTDILEHAPTAIRQFSNPTKPGTVRDLSSLDGYFSRYGVD